MSSRPPFFTSARGHLLIFNLLVVAVTLMVSGVAVLGFRHASQIQEQVQQQTLDDMTGSMNLARDTANVATAAVRLSQVVGALEYKGEAERLKQTQMALATRWSSLPMRRWRSRSRRWWRVLSAGAMSYSRA
jgi:hypothetical protein